MSDLQDKVDELEDWVAAQGAVVSLLIRSMVVRDGLSDADIRAALDAVADIVMSPAEERPELRDRLERVAEKVRSFAVPAPKQGPTLTVIDGGRGSDDS